MCSTECTSSFSVKCKVYHTKEQDIVQLKERITAAVASVTPEMLESVPRENEYRDDLIRALNGAHVECSLKRTRL